MKKWNSVLVRRSAAGVAAAVLLSGAAPVTAFAEGQPVQAPLNKTVTKRETTLSPRVSFGFTVEPGTADEEENILAGPAGGAVMGDDVNFAPADSDIGQTSLTQSTSITLNPSAFSEPGVYHYVIKERQDTYDGMTYDNSERDLLVYVVNDAAGGLAIGGYTMRKGEDKSETFTNDYGATNQQVNNLTITKTVTGNMGNYNKEFDFAVQVTPAEEGEEYYLVVNGETDSAVRVGTEKTNFTLKHGESAVLYGLSPNDRYEVTESDYTAEGYTTTFDGNASGTIDQDTTLTIVNERTVPINTGLVQESAPWLALMGGALGVIGAVAYSRRKRRE